MGSLVDPPAVLTADSDFPELCVEWLPTVGPFSGSGDWCDITKYVQSGSCSRGRQYELEQFKAGALSLTLVSDTRLFDPEYTSGPFYRYLVPMRQVRVSAVWNSVRYSVWRGYITDWGQTVQRDDALYVTSISANDAFALLERLELPASAYALLIQSENPSAWFRLSEADTTRAADSSGNGNYGTYQNVERGKALIPGDSSTGASFGHSEGSKVVLNNPAIITGYPFTVSALINVDGSDPSGWKTIWYHHVNVAAWAEMAIENVIGVNGTLRFAIYDGVNTRAIRSVRRVADAGTHHVAWVSGATASDPWLMYIDGEAVTTLDEIAGNPNWCGPAYVGTYIGNNTVNNQGFGSDMEGDPARPSRGTIQDVAMWNTALSAAQISAHTYASIYAWSSEDSGGRVSRFLDAVGWPSSLRDLNNGSSTMGGASWSEGSSAMSVLQGWADTEYGMFFTDASGRLAWQSRHRPYLVAASKTSQATFSDEAGATLRYAALDLQRDETRIRNPVAASRSSGVAITVRDSSYVDKYGDRTWSSPSTQDKDDAVIYDRAVWLLARYKELGTRVASLTIQPRRNTALWPEALGREIGDRITVKRTPLKTGNQISVEQIIEGVEHSFSPKSWVTRFHASPTDPNVGTLLILDDATYGILDTYRLAY